MGSDRSSAMPMQSRDFGVAFFGCRRRGTDLTDARCPIDGTCPGLFFFFQVADPARSPSPCPTNKAVERDNVWHTRTHHSHITCPTRKFLRDSPKKKGHASAVVWSQPLANRVKSREAGRALHRAVPFCAAATDMITILSTVHNYYDACPSPNLESRPITGGRLACLPQRRRLQSSFIAPRGMGVGGQNQHVKPLQRWTRVQSGASAGGVPDNYVKLEVKNKPVIGIYPRTGACNCPSGRDPRQPTRTALRRTACVSLRLLKPCSRDGTRLAGLNLGQGTAGDP